MLFNRVNPEVTKISLIREMGDGTTFRPQDTGFDFAFGISDEDLDPTIGYYTIKLMGRY